MKIKRILSVALTITLALCIFTPAASAYGKIERGYSVISAGMSHTLAIKSNGTVWAWGSNSQQQLAQSEKINYTKPVQVAGITSAISVAAGYDLSAAVLGSGKIYYWGGGSVSSPREAAGITNAVAVACGQSDYLALTKDGAVWQWTAGNTPKQVSGLPVIADIAAGCQHFLVLTNTGDVWGWGDNWAGQLGLGDTTNRSVPTRITAIGNIVDIAAGYSHSLIAAFDGRLYTFGSNNYGQLGTGDTQDSTIPVQVPHIYEVTQVEAGYENSMARTNKNVYTWGYNDHGQAGNQNLSGSIHSPRLVTGLGTCDFISSGTYHCSAIKNDGTLYIWGRNKNGQLGNGTSVDESAIQKINLDVMPSETAYDTGTFINASSWALPELESLYNRGLTPPVLWQNYKGDMTRAQLAQTLVSVYESVQKTEIAYNEETPFRDIANHPLRVYILKANALAIIGGTSADRASPDAPVTRQEMAKMLCIFIMQVQKGTLNLQQNPSVYYSDDASIQSWAKPYVAYAYENDIMKGTGSAFEPNSKVTGETALIVVERLAVKYGWK